MLENTSPSGFLNNQNGLVTVDEEMQSDFSSYVKYRLIFTKKANTQFSDKFKQRIIEVFKFFPELHDEIVHVGWIAPNGWARGSCYYSGASTINPLKISLQPNERNFTIAHEFTHLLQRKKKDELQIPCGERACDLWTLTRLPLELIDDYPSYLGSYLMRKHWNALKKPAKMLAFDAIEIRRSKRHYIMWFEDEIKKIVNKSHNR